MAMVTVLKAWFIFALMGSQAILYSMTQEEEIKQHMAHEVKEASFTKKLEELDLMFKSPDASYETFRISFAPTLLGTINNNGGLIRVLDCIFNNVDKLPKLKDFFTPSLLALHISPHYFSVLQMLFQEASIQLAHENTINTLFYFFTFECSRSGRNRDVLKDPFAILGLLCGWMGANVRHQFYSSMAHVFRVFIKSELINIHALDAEGETIIDRLLLLRQPDFVDFIMSKPNFNVKATADSGLLLHRVDQKMCEQLITCGVEVNIQNADGDTRLHLLARQFVGYIRPRKGDHSYEVTYQWNRLANFGLMLIKSGARLDLPNRAGETVQQILNALSADGMRPAFAVRFS